MKEIDYLNKNRVKDAYNIEEANLPKPTDKIRKIRDYSKVGKTILIVLLIVFAIYLCLHPVDKLKVKMFLFRNCTVEARIVGDINNRESVIMKISGNTIKIGQTYYSVSENTVYCHYRYNYGWKREEVSEDSSIRSSEEFSKYILNVNNYERVKGKLFEWKLKDNIDTGEYKNFTIKRVKGHIAFCFEYEGEEFCMMFKYFGLSWFYKPWK